MMYYTFFDIETSVESKKALAGVGGITQISAITVDADFETIDTIDLRIKFRVSEADNWVLALTHYDEKLWEDAVHPMDALNLFAEFLNPTAVYPRENYKGETNHFAIMGGHNISAFDLPVLLNWEDRLRSLYLKQYNLMKLPVFYLPCIDTLHLALAYSAMTNVWFTSYKLVELAEYFGMTYNAHDALEDVKASIYLAKILRKELKLGLDKLIIR